MDFEIKDCTLGNHPEYDKGFKAGQQSKQAEIDALQKRIDDAITYSRYWYKSSGSALALEVIKILKGVQK